MKSKICSAMGIICFLNCVNLYSQIYPKKGVQPSLLQPISIGQQISLPKQMKAPIIHDPTVTGGSNYVYLLSSLEDIKETTSFAAKLSVKTPTYSVGGEYSSLVENIYETSSLTFVLYMDHFTSSDYIDVSQLTFSTLAQDAISTGSYANISNKLGDYYVSKVTNGYSISIVLTMNVSDRSSRNNLSAKFKGKGNFGLTSISADADFKKEFETNLENKTLQCQIYYAGKLDEKILSDFQAKLISGNIKLDQLGSLANLFSNGDSGATQIDYEVAPITSVLSSTIVNPFGDFNVVTHLNQLAENYDRHKIIEILSTEAFNDKSLSIGSRKMYQRVAKRSQDILNDIASTYKNCVSYNSSCQTDYSCCEISINEIGLDSLPPIKFIDIAQRPGDFQVSEGAGLYSFNKSGLMPNQDVDIIIHLILKPARESNVISCEKKVQDECFEFALLAKQGSNAVDTVRNRNICFRNIDANFVKSDTVNILGSARTDNAGNLNYVLYYLFEPTTCLATLKESLVVLEDSYMVALYNKTPYK